jgi:hypothetical protein
MENKLTTEMIVDLVKVQTQLKNTPRSAQGYGYKYTPLDVLLDIVKPVLQLNNLVLLQTINSTTVDSVTIETLLVHASGGCLMSSFTLPQTELAKSNSIQKLGSSISYGRRYSIITMLGIASEDDTDGNTSKNEVGPKASDDDIPFGNEPPPPAEGAMKPKTKSKMWAIAFSLWPKDKGKTMEKLAGLSQSLGHPKQLRELSEFEAMDIIGNLKRLEQERKDQENEPTGY